MNMELKFKEYTEAEKKAIVQDEAIFRALSKTHSPFVAWRAQRVVRLMQANGLTEGEFKAYRKAYRLTLTGDMLSLTQV